jgi:hypothetical protein
VLDLLLQFTGWVVHLLPLLLLLLLRAATFLQVSSKLLLFVRGVLLPDADISLCCCCCCCVLPRVCRCLPSCCRL